MIFKIKKKKVILEFAFFNASKNQHENTHSNENNTRKLTMDLTWIKSWDGRTYSLIFSYLLLQSPSKISVVIDHDDLIQTRWTPSSCIMILRRNEHQFALNSDRGRQGKSSRDALLDLDDVDRLRILGIVCNRWRECCNLAKVAIAGNDDGLWTLLKEKAWFRPFSTFERIQCNQWFYWNHCEQIITFQCYFW